jgi:hypothetical protein
MVDVVSGVKFPDTKLAKEATGLVREASPLPLFNHCLRAYVFADSLGRKMNRRYDSELLYLACVMHDLGLVEQCIKKARFEIDGADAAEEFLTHHGYSPEKIAVVWEAIALHASMEIPLRRQSEVALVHMGAFMDGGIMKVDEFPTSFYEEVFEALPRLQSRKNFIEMLANVLKRKPNTAYLAFEADIARRNVPDFGPPNFCDWTEHPPFNK